MKLPSFNEMEKSDPNKNSQASPHPDDSHSDNLKASPHNDTQSNNNQSWLTQSNEANTGLYESDKQETSLAPPVMPVRAQFLTGLDSELYEKLELDCKRMSYYHWNFTRPVTDGNDVTYKNVYCAQCFDMIQR